MRYYGWMMQKHWTKEDRLFLAERWLSGWSSGRIAREMGVTRSAVMGAVWRMGLTRNATHAEQLDRIQSGFTDKRVKEAKDVRKAREPKPREYKIMRIVHPNKPSRPVSAQTPPKFTVETPMIPGVGVSIYDAQPCHCRWVLRMPNRETGEQALYCGQPVRAHAEPWCEDHYKRVYNFEAKHRRAPGQRALA